VQAEEEKLGAWRRGAIAGSPLRFEPPAASAGNNTNTHSNDKRTNIFFAGEW
jgi:hypothetical protein